MGDVTSRDVMSAADISDVDTLTRWYAKERLIPAPEIRTHPNGRGKIAYWPEWVLHRCVRIKQLRKGGKSLAEIREILGNDWSAASRDHERRYRFIDASRTIDKGAALRNMRELVADVLIRWVKTHHATMLDKILQGISAGTIDKAVEMVEQGINPVLVLTSQGTVLTADFAVSHYLSRCRSVDDSFMVLPVWRELSAYLGKVATIPPEPAIIPVAKVVRGAPSPGEESEVMVLDSWEFEIAPAKSDASRRKKG